MGVRAERKGEIMFSRSGLGFPIGGQQDTCTWAVIGDWARAFLETARIWRRRRLGGSPHGWTVLVACGDAADPHCPGSTNQPGPGILTSQRADFGATSASEGNHASRSAKADDLLRRSRLGWLVYLDAHLRTWATLVNDRGGTTPMQILKVWVDVRQNRAQMCRNRQTCFCSEHGPSSLWAKLTCIGLVGLRPIGATNGPARPDFGRTSQVWAKLSASSTTDVNHRCDPHRLQCWSASSMSGSFSADTG